MNTNEQKPAGALAVMDDDRRVLVSHNSVRTMAFAIAKHDEARAAFAELVAAATPVAAAPAPVMVTPQELANLRAALARVGAA